jgi:hypothetical protein
VYRILTKAELKIQPGGLASPARIEDDTSPHTLDG